MPSLSFESAHIIVSTRHSDPIMILSSRSINESTLFTD